MLRCVTVRGCAWGVQGWAIWCYWLLFGRIYIFFLMWAILGRVGCHRYSWFQQTANTEQQCALFLAQPEQTAQPAFSFHFSSPAPFLALHNLSLLVLRPSGCFVVAEEEMGGTAFGVRCSSHPCFGRRKEEVPVGEQGIHAAWSCLW